MPSVHTQLSEQFYRWERRGRGYEVYAEPICPEPPFQPFDRHVLPSAPATDDGLRPTFLSSLADRLFGGARRPASPPSISTREDPKPVPLCRGAITQFEIVLPRDLDVPREVFANFLRTLTLCCEPIAFELLGREGVVTLHFATAAPDAPLFCREALSYFPNVHVIERKDLLQNAWDESLGDEALAFEFGLKREFMFPLAVPKLDPYFGLIAGLSMAKQGEFALLQVLFQPLDDHWRESTIASVTHADGRAFFVNAPELTDAAKEKVRTPLFATVIRILIRAETYARLIEIGRNTAGPLSVFGNPGGNSLIPLENAGYPFGEHIEDVLARQSRRSGMILNLEELTGFVHLPSKDVPAAILSRETKKTVAAPSRLVRSHGLLLGTNSHAGKSTEIRLTPEERVRHCHVIGASGTGKSTLLFNLIRQDITNGEGLAVLDPHGDLIDRILGIIPGTRADDVVLFDPSDPEYAVGFNVLSAHSEVEKNLLASDLVSVFERLATSWGDQMGSVLKNAILASLESTRGGTLADLRRFLIEPPFRNDFLTTVVDSEVLYYWYKSFPTLAGNRSIGSIITRLDAFLATKPIRHVVSQKENRLDFEEMMDSGKIFLAKLPEGLLGRENSYLLGSLLISKFQQITMSRQAQAVTHRRNFWIYIDEFANFITPSMAEILSGARKYRIGLTLAHHELRQLSKIPEVESAVLTHPATRIVFRVGDADAKKLAEGFSHFDTDDLLNLEIGEAICRVERSQSDFNLAIPAADDGPSPDLCEHIVAASRRRYGTRRDDIEAMLREVWRQTRNESLPRDHALRATVSVPQPTPEPAQTRPTVSDPAPSVRKPASPQAEPDPKQNELFETAPSPKASVGPTAPVPDESLHGLIKERIRTVAESLGYSVEPECKLLDGRRVDVVLHRGTRVIACEVSNKNALEDDIGNIEKCFKAGFCRIVVVAEKKTKLRSIEKLMRERLSKDVAGNVIFRLPDELMSDLEEWAKQDPEGAAIEKKKPHKHKISLRLTMTEIERLEEEKALLKALSEEMERKKL